MHPLKWFENLWNLRLIFDKYLAQIRKLTLHVDILQEQVEDLRAVKLEMAKELAKLKAERNNCPVENTTKKGKPSFSVDQYYTPQTGVKYVVTEVNGEKVSPNDDTSVEHY